MHFRGLSKDETLLKNRVDESYEEICKNKNQFRMVSLFGQKIEASSTNWSISCGSSGLFDLNETPPVNKEPVSNHHQPNFFQDLNFPYTEETEMSNEKRDFTPISSPASCCTAENIGREDSFEIAAAECLVDISAVSLNQGQKSNKHEMSIEEPSSCSCDSYELHVLGISETMALEDECCVSSSKSIDEYNNDKKEFGIIKVRRGKRRMKNFQKEILPGLVSLSRNEIREDINILDAVLRSKEYKKMQGKKTRRDVKCKDSTKRYVGRRRRRIE